MADCTTPPKPSEIVKALQADNATLKSQVETVTKANADLVTRIDKLEKTPVYDVARLAATPRDAKEEGMWGFKSFSHYLDEVKKCPRPDTPLPGGMIAKMFESEMIRKAATGMGELVGSDGGFLVPPTFSERIMERVYREGGLLERADKHELGGNTMIFPRNNESSRVDGSRWGGVQTYWTQEGLTITASSPTFGQVRLDLHKLACVVPLTNELKQDAPAVEGYLTKVFSSEIDFESTKAIYRGNGVGRPLGLINSVAALTVSAETGQQAKTIVTQNIVKMWARRFALGPTGNYVWLVNQDVTPQLYTLTLGIGTAGIATFMPPGGVSAKPYATLMGAPVIEIEQASTLGTTGDIALVDMSQYLVGVKGGPQTMSSMHVYFLTDQDAVRTTWRLDGKLWWGAALTPYQGSNTQSPVILLATR